MGDALKTRAEVAAEFRISVRHMIEMERAHQIPVLRLGRRVLFDDASIAILKEAARCPSRLNGVKTPEPYGSSAPLSLPAKPRVSEFAAALALTTPPSREKKLQRLKLSSSGTSGTEKKQSRAASARRPSPT
jgi:hypothetical protein